MLLLSQLVTLVLGLSVLASTSANASTSPVVTLDYGSFEGFTEMNITSFLGMPFAAPPTGKLRFMPPQPPISFKGIHNATAFGKSCIPQAAANTPIPANASEDCLTINVMKPANAPTQKLPVIVWIYGGAFEVGSTASPTSTDGLSVVNRSMAIGEPVMHVSMNYRLAGFGFLASKEVQDRNAGNIGLRDQRFALEWVQKYISKFGGDPDRVVIWGISAGAVSVALQLLINEGDPAGLFHGAFMNSGSPMALDPITFGQQYYDFLVSSTSCTSSNDTFACLQNVPVEQLSDAINDTPLFTDFPSLDLTWIPRIDGEVLKESTAKSIVEGKYAKVPFVTGDCDDEGTVFSLGSLNITTNAEFLAYIKSHYLFNSTAEEINLVSMAYPQDPAKGSPFGTGDANALTPEFKRLAAFQGDWAFQAPRRFFLTFASKTQDTWAFLYKRQKSTPNVGSAHLSDYPEFHRNTTGFSDFIGTDAIINFANTLNPTLPHNSKSLLTTSGINWTKWTTESPTLLTFLDPAPTIVISNDTYRKEAMELLSALVFNLD